ncbi:MAG: ImmA/IrrE family metallo-endopeptidase [Candidatus Aenigmarchaeota archaeon]|nr:ImmA/IrrE family metallo-endopeptidase [Candidatus Aenigmarchaeota archaeon]
MSRTIEVDIDSAVFKWLRESAGWSIEETSKKIYTSVDTVIAIESGKKKPTLRQLKELSNAFKRPLASFLLSEPKEEKSPPKDYRMLPNKVNIFDKKTLLVLRKARSLQTIGKELSQNLEDESKIKTGKFKLSDNPKEIANKYRNLFKIDEKKQKGFKTTYDFFNYVRDVLENINIIVFQFSIPVEDARGFVLIDESPAVIVVSTQDCIEARLFTLMHEFAHILLGESAIDIPDACSISNNNIEKWCNQFSSSFLFPKEIAKPTFNENKRNLTDRKTLNSLSRKYKVSKAMILINMYKLDFISKSDLNKILDRYKPKAIPKEAKETKTGGGMTADKKCVSEVGTKFVSLVANNYDRGYITYTDALNYLSIKSKNFDKVLSRAVK